MSARGRGEPPENHGEPADRARVTAEEAERLITEARERGEPIAPIVKRFALSTVDEVIATLEAERS